jgi:hypothetical protein
VWHYQPERSAVAPGPLQGIEEKSPCTRKGILRKDFINTGRFDTLILYKMKFR